MITFLGKNRLAGGSACPTQNVNLSSQCGAGVSACQPASSTESIVEWSVRILCALFAAGCILAQEPNASDETDQQDPDQTYQGPSILSRDKSLVGERGGKLLDFRYYAEVTGVFDSGLVLLNTNAQGNLVNVGGAYGVETGFGVIGTRRWKRDKLSLEYKGAYRQYSISDVPQGLDQFLNLAYGRRMTERLTLDLKETAGTVSLANGVFTYLPLTNTDLSALPANELFDIRTNFAQSRVDLTWQKTARLSFGLGGEGFVVRRSSLLLAGLNGYDAHANMAYRLTGRQTVSGDYNYTYYDFQRAFGNARLQSVSLGYAIGLSHKYDFSLRAGGIRIDSLGITQVPIDPAIAAIVGESYANVTLAQRIYAPLGEARLMRRFDRSSLTLDYSVGASPGNGVYLTSRATAAGVSYSYAGYRRWTFALNSGYTELSAIGQTLGKYTNVQGGTGVTYKVGRETHIQFRYDYRHYTTQNNIYQKDSNRVSLGLAFSPGETPLAIW